MMNPQVRYGEDVMSRITYCMMNEETGLKDLQQTILEGLNAIAKRQLIRQAIHLKTSAKSLL